MATIPIDEAARRLGLDMPAMRQLVRDGTIPAVAVLGGMPLIEEGDVDRYVREHAQKVRGTTNIREG